MKLEPPDEKAVLVLDTCAERGSIALFRGNKLLREDRLEERTASAVLLRALRSVLQAHGMELQDVAGIGVVRGPGSFTGVRVGLALAKGLCEAASLPLAGVSRLTVLAEAAALTRGFALLAAGREQVYVRDVQGSREWLANFREVESLVRTSVVAVVSPELAVRLERCAKEIRSVELSARHAIGAVRRCLAEGGSDLARTDANYVRNEDAIYAKAGIAPSDRDATLNHV